MKTKETGSMTDHELLQQALNALKHLCLHSAAIKGYDGEQVQTAIDALKARLAQPEPYPENFIDALRFDTALREPVAWMHNFIDDVIIKNRPTDITCNAGRWTALYTAPPQREWVGLTDKEIEDCLEMSIQGTCRAIEAKLKEKNT
jgi:hypothetical protein